MKFEIGVSQKSFYLSVFLQTYKINIYILLAINWRLGTLKASEIKDGEEASANI